MRHPRLSIVCRASIVFAACGWVLCVLSGCTGPVQSVASPSASLDLMKPAKEVSSDLPPSAATLYSLADILAAQGKDRECEFVLRTCMRQHPRFMPAYNSLAELFMRQGRVKEAAEVLSDALRVNPQDPVLLKNLGMCLLISRQHEKALACFTDAAGVAPKADKYRANMATTLGLLGRQDEAEALLEQVLPAGIAAHDAQVLQKAREKVSNAKDSPLQ